MPRRFSRRPKSFPERVWLGLRAALSRRLDTPWFFPVAGLVLIGAMALGMMLGNSTVAAIDPVAFRAPPPVRASRGGPIPPGGPSADYGWPGGVDCGPECGAYAADGPGAMRGPPPDPGAHVPYYGSRRAIETAVAQARDELGPAFPETGPDVGVAGGPIQRYSHFPVTRDERDRRDGRASEAVGGADALRLAPGADG
jgi:hypothetical protein